MAGADASAGAGGGAGTGASGGLGGGGVAGDGGTAGTGAVGWVEVAVTGDSLTPRRGHSAVLNPDDETVYVFGGRGYHDLSDELFSFAWGSGVVTKVPGAGTGPSARSNHVAVLDGVRKRMLVFGGRGFYDLYDDVYALDVGSGAGSWKKLSPTGTRPSAREGHVAVFEAARNRLVVFGGQGFHDLYADTWALSFAAGADGVWSRLSPAGVSPAARTEAAVAFDPATSRMFVGGGQGYHDVPRDVAVLDLTSAQGSWSLQSPSPAAPENGVAGAWIWDDVASQLFQFSGQTYHGLLSTPQTVDLASGQPGTTQTGAAGLPELVDAAMLHIPGDHTAVLIGGESHHDLSGRIFVLKL